MIVNGSESRSFRLGILLPPEFDANEQYEHTYFCTGNEKNVIVAIGHF